MHLETFFHKLRSCSQAAYAGSCHGYPEAVFGNVHILFLHRYSAHHCPLQHGYVDGSPEIRPYACAVAGMVADPAEYVDHGDFLIQLLVSPLKAAFLDFLQEGFDIHMERAGRRCRLEGSPLCTGLPSLKSFHYPFIFPPDFRVLGNTSTMVHGDAA